MIRQQPIIVDTNILFSAFIRKQTGFTDVLFQSSQSFFMCEQVLVELFKHKERISHASKLTEDDIIWLYHALIKRIILYKEGLIAPEHRIEAYTLCCDIDESDTPHVALTLHLHGLLWTGDKKLKEGLKQKGFQQFFEVSDLGN